MEVSVTSRSTVIEEFEHQLRPPELGVRVCGYANSLAWHARRLKLRNAVSVTASKTRRSRPAMISLRPNTIDRWAMRVSARDRTVHVFTLDGWRRPVAGLNRTGLTVIPVLTD